MSEERIVRSTLSDRRKGKTDWARVDAMTEEEIEEAARSDPDNPPLDEEFFKHARIVTPPPKKAVHLRIDSDVLEWFKRQGKGYQTRMNAVLRAYMEARSGRSNDQRPD
ncbi:MAG TPA: BrnA antitoxin family protein [Dehalococcoidia bacterium]|nr:BrnA antitoxin family protein [Dehalococcoidia bacterium]